MPNWRYAVKIEHMNENPLLTQKQRNILLLIKAHIDHYGYGPVQTVLAKKCGLKTQSGIQGHIRALEKKGFIRRLRGPKGNSLPGAILIVKMPERCPGDEEIKWN